MTSNEHNTAIERDSLLQAIAALEQQRVRLGDHAVDLAVASLRTRLSELDFAVRQQDSERKVITVVFIDVSGFTSMSERLDSEIVRDTINGLFDRLGPVIERYGGVIERFLGDGLMAIFGAPVASEHHAENALRACLESFRALHDFNDERGEDLGIRPQTTIVASRPASPEVDGWLRAFREIDAPILHLHPLSDESMRELVSSVLVQAPGIPPPDSLLSKAAGNPFFLRSFLRSLIDDGLASLERNRVVVTGPIDDLAVPSSLQAVVAGQIDLLDRPQRSLLRCAAVLGRRFRSRCSMNCWSERQLSRFCAT